ncbi:MAG: hypothetical protein KGH98_04285 [Candidatus Micrarchaeota archaeon]|nr:hypothetical protein [Candidatus Micrarchaeota archaeon]
MYKVGLALGVVALLLASCQLAAADMNTPYIAANVSSLVSYAKVPYNGFAPVYAAFLNGTIVSEVYLPVTDPKNFSCSPRTPQVFQNELAVANITWCEAGAKGNTIDADPQWLEIPAFAGMTIFGSSFGANQSGFPVFQNRSIMMHCGSGVGSPTMCLDHPTLMYSPLFTDMERLINITNGTQGLPEGVLPVPSHDHLIITDENGQFIRWYLVNVLVFDPNIFPDARTGKCAQIANSSLQDPTLNCLVSLGAVANAMTTNDSAVAAINANNPVWIAAGRPMTEVYVPNDTVSTLNQSNANVDMNFSIQYVDPYTGTRVQKPGSAPQGSLTIPPTQAFSAAMPEIVIGIIVGVIIISVVFHFYFSRRRDGSQQYQPPA